MFCRMPVLSLPDDVTQELEQSESGKIDGTEGPGVASYRTRDGCPCINVYVGLKLDGFKLYENISSIDPSIKMTFAVEPVISCQSDVVTFKTDYDSVINIQVG